MNETSFNSSRNSSSQNLGSNTSINGMAGKRNKVSKACESCRRRKIKCSGSSPCSSCLTYDCDCVYSGTSSTNQSNGITKNSRSRSNKISKVSISKEKSKENGKNLDYFNEKKNESNSGDSTLNSYHDQENETMVENSNIISLNKLENIEIVNDDYGYLYDDNAIQIKLQELQISLKTLHSILDNCSNETTITNISGAIENINKEIESITKNYIPKLDSVKLRSYRENRSVDSIETILLKNKYSSKVNLSNIAVWHDQERINKRHKSIKEEGTGLDIKISHNHSSGKNCHKERKFDADNICLLESASASALANLPLIDEITGLYSAVSFFSMRGIGSFFQRRLLSIGNSDKDKLFLIHLKETVYVILRFFDICIDNMKSSCTSISNPLEGYYQKKAFDTATSDLIPSPIVSKNSPNYLEHNRDILIAMIKKLPQPLLYNMTNGITTDKLIKNVDESFHMFSLILKIFDIHIIKFGEFQEIKSVQEKWLKIENMLKRKSLDLDQSYELLSKDLLNSSFLETYSNFCKQEDLLLSLVYFYYNATLYHFEDSRSLDYLEALISLLEKQIALDDFYASEKVLEVAIGYAMKMGLLRWEYSAGISESIAEKRRDLWWKLYQIEKMASLEQSTISAIDDSMITCILPKPFTDIGFLSIKEFLLNIPSSTIPKEVFESKSILEQVEYGTYSILFIISDYFSKVLYEERYTSIRNFSLPPYLKQNLTKEIYNHLEVTTSRFEIIRKQLNCLFETLDNNIKNPEQPKLTVKEFRAISEYVFKYYYSYIHIMNGTKSILSRFLVQPVIEEFALKREKYLNLSVAYWEKMNTMMSRDRRLYCIPNCLKYYALTCLVLLSHQIVSFLKIQNIIHLAELVSRTHPISFFRKLPETSMIINTKPYKDFCRKSVFLALITNLISTSYMEINNLSKDEFMEEASRVNDEYLLTLSYILDPKSSVYDFIMIPVKESGFHLKVRSIFTDTKNIINNKKNKAKQEVETNVSTNNNNDSTTLAKNIRIAHGNSNAADAKNEINKKQRKELKKLDFIIDELQNKTFSDDISNDQLYNQITNVGIQNATSTNILLHSQAVTNSNNSHENDYIYEGQNSGSDMKRGNSIHKLINENINPFERESSGSNISAYTPNALLDNFSPDGNGNMIESYNLGTLDEFINEGDLNDLYNALWKNMYPN